MARVNIFMQKQGRSGKTTCAALFYQALLAVQKTAHGLDLNPSSSSLAAFQDTSRGLQVEALDTDGLLGLANLKKLDGFMAAIERIAAMKAGAEIIVDSSAAGYPALWAYLRSPGLAALARNGHQVRLHVPLVGGGSQAASMECLGGIVKDFPKAQVVTWVNPYFGELAGDDGGPFLESGWLRQLGSSLAGVVSLPDSCSNTLCQKALNRLLSRHGTFEAAPHDFGLRLDMFELQRQLSFWHKSRRAMELAGMLKP